MIEAENTWGQVLAIGILVAWCGGWVAVAMWRERRRGRQRLSRIAKVSGGRRTVGPTTDRSEA